jgi:hypothetical protein
LVYELPKAKGWEVLMSEVGERYTFIDVTTTLYHANVSQESRLAWKPKVYRIKIPNYDNGKVEINNKEGV